MSINAALDRFLALIGILAGIAPLLGLLGTVTGMLVTFDVISVIWHRQCQGHGRGDFRGFDFHTDRSFDRHSRIVYDQFFKTPIGTVEATGRGGGDVFEAICVTQVVGDG